MDEDNNLIFEYSTETTAPTPVNLTNHTYWNLRREPRGKKILDPRTLRLKLKVCSKRPGDTSPQERYYLPEIHHLILQRSPVIGASIAPRGITTTISSSIENREKDKPGYNFFHIRETGEEKFP